MRVEDIPVDERDPWEGLGMNEETILDKVVRYVLIHPPNGY